MKQPISMQYKLGILILGIIFLTYSMPYIVEKVMEHREQQEKKYRKKMGLDDPVIEGFGIDDIIGPIKSIVSIVTEMVPTIFNGILKILMYFLQIVTGLPLLLTGMGMHFLCGGLEFKDGFLNGIEVLGVLLKCGLNSFVKFFNGQCTIFYIIDVIYGTLYKICIELPIVLLKNIIGLDLQFIVDLIHDLVIIPVDTLIFGLSGYHITKWPDSVVSNCYKCKGKLNGQYLELQYYQWGKMFNCTNSEIMHGMYKMMYSVFPIDRHWMTWSKGRHLDGADDAV
jgi:hypothetical protein